MAQKEIPCYLFVGQLESGKTRFIQETMEDPQFDSGDKTLLLVFSARLTTRSSLPRSLSSSRERMALSLA